MIKYIFIIKFYCKIIYVMMEVNYLLWGYNMGWLRMKYCWLNILIYDVMIVNFCYVNCINVCVISCCSMFIIKEVCDKVIKFFNGYFLIYIMCWWRRKIVYFGVCVVVFNRIEYRYNSFYKKFYKNVCIEWNGIELIWKVCKNLI